MGTWFLPCPPKNNYNRGNLYMETIQLTQQQLEREQYIQENQAEWEAKGIQYRDRRIDQGITLRQMAIKMGTSSTRIRNFEKGLPVIMPNAIEQSYKMALELLELEMNLDDSEFVDEELDFSDENATIDHVRIVHDGGDLYILNFVTKSGQKIHVEDIVELKWAHLVGKNKYATPFNVPLILEMSNGEEVALSKDWQFA
jgi:transcriptional regulator with XRE-family HTH domain